MAGNRETKIKDDPERALMDFNSSPKERKGLATKEHKERKVKIKINQRLQMLVFVFSALFCG
jgi:hypothetical protein